MDEYQTQPDPNVTAWTLSTLGSVINAYVDRTVNRPQVVHDASQAYGVDEYGNLYNLGQPNAPRGQSGVQISTNPLTLMLLLGLVFVMVKK